MPPFATTTPRGRCLRLLGVTTLIMLLLGGCAAGPPPMPAIKTISPATAAALVEAAPATPLPSPVPAAPTEVPASAALPTVEQGLAEPPATAPAVSNVPVAAPGQTATSFDALGVQNMLRSLNNVRATAGCPLVSLDPRLHSAATDHARDLAGRGAIDHGGADGTALDERLTNVGYPFQRRAEIIGRGSIQPVVDTWLNEPDDGPHRSALLDCAYNAAGVGLAIAPDGTAYWVVDLAHE